MSNINSGKASVFALTAVAVFAAFLLGNSYTNVSAKHPKKTPPPVDYCLYECPTKSLMVCPLDDASYTGDEKTDCAREFGEKKDKYTKYANKVLYEPKIDVIYNKDDKDPHKCHRPTDKDLEKLMTKDQVKTFKEDYPEFLVSEAVAPDGYYLEDGVCYPEEETSTPTPTPTSSIEPTPTATPTSNNTTSSSGNDGGDGLGCATHDCSGNVVPQGQVLGASTMAGTGTFEEAMYLAIMGLGGISTILGAKSFKKASKKA